MRTTRRWGKQDGDRQGIGPQLGFAAATLSGFTAWSGLVVTSRDLAMPVLASLFLMFAATFAITAWRRRGFEDPTRVTYADVAGALTLIGLFAASTIDPENLVRTVIGERPAE